MAKAIRVHATGGPEALTFEDVELPPLKKGDAHIRHTAIGVNFIDVYHRTGLYPQETPFVLGSEGAGEVVAVGEGVTDLKPGDRVAYAGGPLGAYATERVIPAERLVKIPAGVTDETAAAAMLKGMTAQYLLRRTFRVGPEHTILFHAAAGGVGQIACQWASHLGATVIGTAGGPEKVALAKTKGCAHVIDYRSEDFVAKVKEITGGKGVDVVYDSVGKDTFPASLDCIKPRGMWVSFGQSSGPIEPFNIGLLAQKGSLFATRASLNHYAATRPELLATAEDLFDVIASGAVTIDIGARYPLEQAADAHRALEGRATTGSTILIP
ncbi:NADPH2:quinone reductase [Methylopila capsulata]|uniref:NADPH2:quinone reductase n=1 Tax=Methylopila capsulata TaxID=61654 RepID=A0A9W6IWR2_9HYPH|nr:quinone oxidoreductase [Methylopila capsulata]MBM7853178.1 NADPH2:quinone reductase [Methylopila capsulata]GLK57608.1 quinone oxidoreductase [Methylopila capsulata]